MNASAYFDLVLGVDLHLEIVPTPAPVPALFPHPFVGLVFDPSGLAFSLATAAALAALLGHRPTGPVLIGGLPATNTGTSATNALLCPHFVIPPGVAWAPFPKAPTPAIGAHPAKPPPLPLAPAGDAMLALGSGTVKLMGSAAVRHGELALSCSEPVRMLSSTVVALPRAAPVLIGGLTSVDALAAFKGIIRIRWLAGRLHQLLSRLRPGRLRSLLGVAACHFTGHPVDVASGRLMTWATDLALPGPLPLRFERVYSSAWASRPSPLGHGWSHSLDQAVWEERGRVVYRDAEGRELEIDTCHLPGRRLPPGETLQAPLHRLSLRRLGPQGWEVALRGGPILTFGPVPGGEPGVARLLSQRSRAGAAVRLSYQGGRLSQVIDSGGRRIALIHDGAGRLVELRAPHPSGRGQRVCARFTHSEGGDLIAAEDALGHATRYAYVGHLLVKETDPTGLSFYFGYDGASAGARCVRTWGDGGIYDHRILYDPPAGRTVVADSLGATWTYEANALGLITAVTDPVGGVRRYEYDEGLRRVAEIDPAGGVTRWSYDDDGDVVEATDPCGATTRWARGPHGPTRAEDPTGAVFCWRYDDAGRLLEATSPLGDRLRFLHDGPQVSAVLLPGGARLGLSWDAAGNLAAVDGPGGGRRTYRWDALGRLVSQRDEAGRLTRWRWDAASRLTGIDEAHGLTTTFEYDAAGSLVRRRRGGEEVILTRGGHRQVTAFEQGGARVELAWDTEGRLRQILNEAGHPFTYTRDAAGRIASEVGFDGATRRLERDAAGRVAAERLPGGIRRTYQRDACGRILAIDYGGGERARFRWDARGALVEAANPSATVRFERDALGRIVREEVGDAWVERRWGPLGEALGLSSSAGLAVSMEADARGGMIRAEAAVGGGARWEASLARDALGQEVRRALPGAVEVRSAWDAASRMVRREVSRLGIPHHALSLSWSPEDLILAAQDDALGPVRYAHDARGRLAAAHLPGGEARWRAPDAVGDLHGQPLPGDRRYDPGGLLREAEGATYRHDPQGRLVERRQADGGRWTYAWDGAGALREVVRPDGARITYTYDALGRRLSRRHGDQLTTWQWAGDVVVHERAAGQAPTTWLFEPGGWAPLASHQGGRWLSVVTDHRGAPLTLYDPGGEARWDARLDEAGRAHALIPPQARCPWRFPGQEADAEIGLHYNRHRYYDPHLGRYISPDPVGLAGGLAPYAYVICPLTWVDPLGLTGSCVQIHRGTDYGNEQEILHETGLLMSDAARRAYSGVTRSGGTIQQGIAAALSASRRAHAHQLRLWGSLSDYIQAHCHWGHELSRLAERSLISCSTDPLRAEAFGKTVLTGSVPAEELLRQVVATSTEGEVLFIHMLELR